MGLDKTKVELEKYNPNWKKEFEKEKKELGKIIRGLYIDIEHVGSTSIPGISAKPIIDILISVKSLKDCDNLLKNLDNAGYSVRYDNAEKGEYLVRKGPEDSRTHYIHVVEDKADRCTEMIIFRDYLINNPEYIEQYQTLKEELASKYKNDRKMYTASKNEFIKMVLDKARETN